MSSKSNRQLPIIGTAGAAIFIVGVVVVGIGVALYFKAQPPAASIAGAVAGPSPGREGEEWTYRELRDHLERKGMNYRIQEYDGAVCFVDAGLQFDHALGAATNASRGTYVGTTIRVDQAPSASDAKDRAGRYEHGAVNWGRFVIYGRDEVLAKIRTALR